MSCMTFTTNYHMEWVKHEIYMTEYNNDMFQNITHAKHLLELIKCTPLHPITPLLTASFITNTHNIMRIITSINIKNLCGGFPSYSPGKFHVFWHDSDMLSMYSAHVCILK